MKKVVILGPSHPLRGGLASYNERLAREFQVNGYEVKIETFSLQYPGFLFPGKSQFSSEPKPENLDIRVSINSINPFNWLRVGNRVKKMNADLVLIKFWLPFMGPCLGTLARRARSNKHTKVISIIDNIIPHEKRMGDKVLANYFAKGVDGFIAQSQSVMDDLDLFDKNKPKKLSPHPLFDNFGELMDRAEARKLLNIDPEEKLIFFFGFIRDYKGLDLLIEAMAQEKLRDYPVKLFVAGEFYNEPQKYYDLVEKHNLKDRVIFHSDFIPDSEVNRFFSMANLVVQPYKSATQSGVTQIAYHFNKPMVVTNVGGLKEIVPDNKVGYVVEPDPEEIAVAVRKYFDEEKEKEFSDNMEKEKKKYSWSKMVESIWEVANSVKK